MGPLLSSSRASGNGPDPRGSAVPAAARAAQRHVAARQVRHFHERPSGGAHDRPRGFADERARQGDSSGHNATIQHACCGLTRTEPHGVPSRRLVVQAPRRSLRAGQPRGAQHWLDLLTAVAETVPRCQRNRRGAQHPDSQLLHHRSAPSRRLVDGLGERTRRRLPPPAAFACRASRRLSPAARFRRASRHPMHRRRHFKRVRARVRGAPRAPLRRRRWCCRGTVRNWPVPVLARATRSLPQRRHAFYHLSVNFCHQRLRASNSSCALSHEPRAQTPCAGALEANTSCVCVMDCVSWTHARRDRSIAHRALLAQACATL
eukprot:Amastigsp_a339278_145.p1 type:complete len:319 gc:universal Amastigsp_a339278_145:1-957(+)